MVLLLSQPADKGRSVLPQAGLLLVFIAGARQLLRALASQPGTRSEYPHLFLFLLLQGGFHPRKLRAGMLGPPLEKGGNSTLSERILL